MNASPPAVVRKSTGLTWAPEVPSDWDIKRGKFLFELQKRAVLPDDDIVTAFRDGQVTLRKNRRTDGFTNALKEAGYQRVHKGDLVIHAMDAFAGAVGVSDADGKCTPVYSCCTPKEGVSAEFYARMIRTMALSGFIESLAKGIRERSTDFRWREFAEQPLPIPPIEQQLRIVAFLDRETGRIDGLIEKKTRFIALLNEKEKAAISRLVRRGLERNAPTTESGVDWRGRVPAHWVRGRMKDHFRQEKRQGYENLTVLSVYREFGVIEKASRDDNINKTPEDLTKYQLVKPNDLVINKMKAWQGSMGIAQMRGITSPDYVVMRPIGEHDPRYMHHYLRAQPMPWVYRLISNGIRTDQWRMEPEKFLGLPVFMPPIDEQRRIADRIDVELERIRGLITLTERSIDLLREKRAALITAAVTGKIDVRAAA